MIELNLTESFFEKHIPLSRPSYLPYIDEVSQEVDKVLRSGMIAMGQKVKEFEQMIADYCGTRYAIAVSSGTAGLYVCLKALDVGTGDEVITSPYTFIATVFAIEAAGAKPLLCDVDRDTYNIDLNKLKFDSLKFIKAYMPVDILGLPKQTNNVNLCFDTIIDSCESLGNKLDRPFAAQVFGLYANKILTTGEGGLICTNDKKINDYCRAYRNQGRTPGDTWLDSSQEGFNYRMTDLQAVIGIVQMKHIDEIIHKRKQVIERYYENGIRLSQRIDYEKFNPFIFVIEVENRIKVMEYLKNKGIDTRAYFPSVHLMGCMKKYGYKKGDFPVSEEISSRTLAIPYYAGMSFADVDYVSECLKEVIKHEL
ncbi:MAG: DegT/DnrJ/EryC1/StrS aminotransferase family protein [Phycisphaerae bacterium]|nr:DegT/DnrJ/EryC1/StrS aminotransferase family protein [Phycisphaerae bacterium]MDD5239944.1 DegT/DnrJ/EryC1/StrS aminotransferase family protein [Candidatus Nanoarchaeia archaeon]